MDAIIKMSTMSDTAMTHVAGNMCRRAASSGLRKWLGYPCHSARVSQSAGTPMPAMTVMLSPAGKPDVADATTLVERMKLGETRVWRIGEVQ